MHIRDIRSPRELVAGSFPRSYCVPVRISGEVARQLHGSVRTLDLRQPRLVETLEKKTRFGLLVDNSGYPSETRELLSGMINISDMVERVLSSVVKYKKDTQLQLLRAHSSAEFDRGDPGTETRCDILLTPKGDRFGYEYVDMGSYVYETWLTRMRVSVDTVTDLVYVVEIDKYQNGAMSRRGAMDSALHKRIEYRVRYDTVSGVQVPSLLRVYMNGEQQLEIHAEYRTFGPHVVFDSKKICYFAEGIDSSSCLSMNYGKYSKGATSCIRHADARTSPRKHHKKLAYAGSLAHKARKAMDKGDIHKASRILNKLIRHCPDTPQGIEAKNILSVLHGY